jgi:ferric-dicitrate binding protein FerR (iron transport regulator)
MANEKTTRGPLTATVGERIGEKAQEGDTASLEHAQAAVDDLRRSGWEGEAHGEAGRTASRPRRSPRRGAGGSGLGWAVAAGLGTFAVIGLVRRAFGR